MRFRIHYVDKYHEAKTLVYECDHFAEVYKFTGSLGNVSQIEPLDEETKTAMLSSTRDNPDEYDDMG